MQECRVDRNEGAPGFEPGTIRSAVGCSTTELCPLFTRNEAIIMYGIYFAFHFWAYMKKNVKVNWLNFKFKRAIRATQSKERPGY